MNHNILSNVTCILTSCGRWDLLKVTLDSFFKYNTYPIKDFYIYEDSPQQIPRDLIDAYPIVWRGTGTRIGQIKALDYLWAEVKTPYAFTMEDDWEFTRPGFIEDSMKVLESDPTILMTWLAPVEPNNVHPIEWGNSDYGVFKTQPLLWSGTRFNPALKRKKDYDLIGSYGAHTTFEAHRPWRAEADIAKVYWRHGFKGAILPQSYIKHIGEGRHIS